MNSDRSTKNKCINIWKRELLAVQLVPATFYQEYNTPCPNQWLRQHKNPLGIVLLDQTGHCTFENKCNLTKVGYRNS